VNVQSPCVTFGQAEAQLRAHKTQMQKLTELGHDPSDRLAAMALAQLYGQALHTGVFYRNPEPPPTYDGAVVERRQALGADAPRRERILEMFRPR
jgi:2-oxoglutarate ferredoxin oxidoreductase subunit beta